jgi:hypothetical protein
MRLVATPRWRRVAQLSAIVAGTGCLSAWFGLSMAGTTRAVAAGPCTTATAPATTGIDIHVDTTNGCDAAGTMLYPVTGTMAANVGSANATVDAPFILEGLSAQKNYWGTYTVTLVCTTGSATNGTYTVPQGAGTYPSAPSTTGTVPTLTGDAAGDVVCTYSLTVQNAPSVTGTGSDKLNSAKIEMWLISGGNVLTQAATVSVDPPLLPVTSPTPSSPSPTPSSPSPTPSSPSPTPSSPSPTPSSPSPTPSSPSPTPSSPSPTPTNGVAGITSTPTPSPAGGVQGIISTPNTGAGGGAHGAGMPLGISGLVLLAIGGLLSRKPKAAPAR